MSELDLMQTYVLVVEKGSFTKAGDVLNISATAVSKQITQLESILGVTLIQRSTRRLAVTDMGNLIYEKCIPVLQSVKDIKRFAQTLNETPSGNLRIASFVALGQSLLVPNLTEFLSLYPEVNIDLKLNDKVPDFNQENIDILFGTTLEIIDQLQSELIAVKLLKSSKILCASPTYLEKHGIPENYQDLAIHHYITHSTRIEDNILSTLQSKHIQLPQITNVNNSTAMIKLALDGLGIIQMGDYALRPFIERGQLQTIISKHKNPTVELYMCYRKMRYIDAKIACFKEFILSKVS